jgi:hypothetical protein
MKDDQYSGAIRDGTVLVKDDALLPARLQNIHSEPYVRGWKLVRGLDGHAMDRRIQEAGWTFFFLAGPINAIAFGFDNASAVRRAIIRILADRGAKKFNSLEITQIESKRFLGIPYASVSAQSRHIQVDGILYADEKIQSFEEKRAANPARLWGTAVGVEEGTAVS